MVSLTSYGPSAERRNGDLSKDQGFASFSPNSWYGVELHHHVWLERGEPGRRRAKKTFSSPTSGTGKRRRQRTAREITVCCLNVAVFVC